MDYYDICGISGKLKEYAIEAEKECKPYFEDADKTAQICEAKVLSAFRKNRVSDVQLGTSTGYGYDDAGRDTLDKIYADTFGCEDALVRINFVSGTHTLSTALFGILRPGDTLLSVTGKPYDTMEKVIGIAGEPGIGSLNDFGIKFEYVPLKDDGSPDYEKISNCVKGKKCAYIQRSRGYSLRHAFDMQEIKKIIDCIKNASPETIIFVDNCYGEFCEDIEPVAVGADLQAGSLIKNPGGGIAKTGGYIAGRSDLVDLCANRLTAVGIGKDEGCTMGQNRELYLGFMHAPSAVANAKKTSMFASALFTLMGYKASPSPFETRGDIVTAIELGSAENLKAFCRGLQKGSPVDSYVTPEPWDMPGYTSQVIMAAGTFTQGSSLEISGDGPIRPPYAVWMQGGITYTSGKTAVLFAAREILENS